MKDETRVPAVLAFLAAVTRLLILLKTAMTATRPEETAAARSAFLKGLQLSTVQFAEMARPKTIWKLEKSANLFLETGLLILCKWQKQKIKAVQCLARKLMAKPVRRS
jgi:hypothetical protein